MIAKTTVTLPARLLAVALLACAVLLSSAVAADAAETTPIHYQKETLAELEKQLAAGQIQSVVVNKRLRSLRTTLKSGEHVIARYKPKEGPRLTSALKAKNVTVTDLTPAEALAEVKSKPVHHKLRYIVGGIVLAVLVIVGVVLFLYRRRKFSREEE
jgi:Flp pilus assembly protein TadB